jgi:hypothetical protein
MDCTITCHDDEIVIDAFCGTKRAPATSLSDLAVSCGASPDTSAGALVAICAKYCGLGRVPGSHRANAMMQNRRSLRSRRADGINKRPPVETRRRVRWKTGVVSIPRTDDRESELKTFFAPFGSDRRVQCRVGLSFRGELSLRGRKNPGDRGNCDHGQPFLPIFEFGDRRHGPPRFTR